MVSCGGVDFSVGAAAGLSITGVEHDPATDRGCLVPLRTEGLAAVWREAAEVLLAQDWVTKRDRRKAKVLRRCAGQLERSLTADRADPESAGGIR